MKLSQLSIIIGLCSAIWTASIIYLRDSVKYDMHELGDELRKDVKKEVAKYQNVYTAGEILELANDNRARDNKDLKDFIKNENRKIKNYIYKERAKYDTIYYEDYSGQRYMELGLMIDGKFYLLKEVKLSKFPFE